MHTMEANHTDPERPDHQPILKETPMTTKPVELFSEIGYLLDSLSPAQRPRIETTWSDLEGFIDRDGDIHTDMNDDLTLPWHPVRLETVTVTTPRGTATIRQVTAPMAGRVQFTLDVSEHRPPSSSSLPDKILPPVHHDNPIDLTAMLHEYLIEGM